MSDIPEQVQLVSEHIDVAALQALEPVTEEGRAQASLVQSLSPERAFKFKPSDPITDAGSTAPKRVPINSGTGLPYTPDEWAVLMGVDPKKQAISDYIEATKVLTESGSLMHNPTSGTRFGPITTLDNTDRGVSGFGEDSISKAVGRCSTPAAQKMVATALFQILNIRPTTLSGPVQKQFWATYADIASDSMAVTALLSQVVQLGGVWADRKLANVALTLLFAEALRETLSNLPGTSNE
jgi:hypothetical protein